MEPMGPLTQLFAMFGLDIEAVATISGIVFFIVEAIKLKMSKNVFFGIFNIWIDIFSIYMVLDLSVSLPIEGRGIGRSLKVNDHLQRFVLPVPVMKITQK